MKTQKIDVNGHEITFFAAVQEEHICLTAIARHKEQVNTVQQIMQMLKRWILIKY